MGWYVRRGEDGTLRDTPGGVGVHGPMALARPYLRSRQSIGAFSGARDDRIVGNVVRGPGGTCQDDTTGSRTAGTANTSRGNVSKHGSTPAAICPAG